MPTGDEELALDEYLDEPMEEWMKEQDDEDGGAEGKPPNISVEELEELDRQAEFEEIERLKKIPVIKELTTEEENDYSEIATRMVTTWKKRQERGGWFRRARLVLWRGNSNGVLKQTMHLPPRVCQRSRGCCYTWHA